MQENELILLGKIVKLHGFHGAVVIALEGDISEKIKEMESVFVEIDGKPVPFFIEWLKETGPQTLQARFEYYDSEKSMAEFIGCNVLSDIESTVAESDSDLPIFLKGFNLHDSMGNELGEIIKVISFPMQVMLEVKSGTADDILIPYNEDWVIAIDTTKKTLSLDLPEGLETINN